jgi:hypothetical protein
LPGFCLARAALERRHRRLLVVVVAAIIGALISNKDVVGNWLFGWSKWYASLAWGALFLYAGSCGILLARRRMAPAFAQAESRTPVPLHQAA